MPYLEVILLNWPMNIPFSSIHFMAYGFCQDFDKSSKGLPPHQRSMISGGRFWSFCCPCHKPSR
uniref:Uncharacterized protein n=1 Tax=Latrodectus hesperus TaxID=256737 RepID=E7D1S0_LATHE|nr:hypothetical protein [Latrodectus hesperus]